MKRIQIGILSSCQIEQKCKSYNVKGEQVSKSTKGQYLKRWWN